MDSSIEMFSLKVSFIKSYRLFHKKYVNLEFHASFCSQRLHIKALADKAKN